MRDVYTRLMGVLYVLCIGICVLSVVIMTILIFVGVIMRGAFGVGAQFAEPLSIFFSVQLTMYGAAACYRAHAHLRLQFFTDMLPALGRRAADIGVHSLVALMGALMAWYGASLTATTWFQAYPEFVYIRVGFVYSAVPISGVITILFALEAILFRRDEQEPDEELQSAIAHAAEEERRLASGDDSLVRG